MKRNESSWYVTYHKQKKYKNATLYRLILVNLGIKVVEVGMLFFFQISSSGSFVRNPVPFFIAVEFHADLCHSMPFRKGDLPPNAIRTAESTSAFFFFFLVHDVNGSVREFDRETSLPSNPHRKKEKKNRLYRSRTIPYR